MRWLKLDCIFALTMRPLLFCASSFKCTLPCAFLFELEPQVLKQTFKHKLKACALSFDKLFFEPHPFPMLRGPGALGSVQRFHSHSEAQVSQSTMARSASPEHMPKRKEASTTGCDVDEASCLQVGGSLSQRHCQLGKATAERLA